MSQYVEHGSGRDAAPPGDPGWPAIVVTDGEGRVVHWSRSATAVYGWTEDEALGRPVGELIVDPVEAEAAAAILSGLSAGESWEGAFRVRHRDGSSFVAHVRDTPVFDATDRLVAILGLSYPVEEPRLPLLAAERGARTSAQRDAERLRRLQQVTAELSRAMTIDEVVECVLARGMELERAGSGSIWLRDPREPVLRFAAATGMRPEAQPRFATIPLDADLPGAAVVRTGRSLYLRSRADRDERWPILTGTPTDMEAVAVVPLVVDGRAIGCLAFGFPDEREFGEGERDFLAALANVCAQVLDRARLYEAERAASARVAFLAEASHVLNSSLDYETTLHRVVDLVRQAFAAEVTVDLDAESDAVAARRTSENAPEMVVPLVARGRTVGTLTVTRPAGAAAFGEEDLALARDLAARGGSAVENARLYAARAAVAATLQRSLLPPRLPDIPGVDLGARYRPAHAGLDVGGDFSDCYSVGDRWAFMLGDVVGSGARAASITALVRHTARAVAPYVAGPADVVRAVREAIVAVDDDEVFCTLLYGAFERTASGVRVEVIGAGHPQPYIVRSTGSIAKVPTGGGLLGVLPPVGIEPVEVLLRPGDALVGVTDGVLEARVGMTFFDESGLVAVLTRTAGAPAADVAGEIEEAVLEFTGGRVLDDVAALVLRAT